MLDDNDLPRLPQEGCAAAWGAWIGLTTLSLTSCAMAEAQNGSAATSDVTNPETGHPLDYNPVTNDHTAQMTLAKTAAMEAYNSGRLREAEARFKEALEEAELGFGPKDAHVASCQNNLAEFYRNTGQFDKAQFLYHQALELLSGLYGESHWLTVSALQNTALLQESRGQLEAAADTMRRVLALRCATLGKGHFLYADALFALAHVLGKQGQWEAAAAQIGQAIAIMEESGSVEGTPVVLWCCELASALQHLGRHDEAVKQMEKALEYTVAVKGDMAAKGSRVAERLVAALTASGQAGRALEVQQTLVSARTALHGHDLRVAESMATLASMHLEQNTESNLMAAEQVAGSCVDLLVQLEQDAQRFSVRAMLSADPAKELEVLQLASRLGKARMLLSTAQVRRGRGAVAEASLRAAVPALQTALSRGQAALKRLGGAPEQQVLVGQVAGALVEGQLQLLELLEGLALVLQRSGANAAQQAEAQALLRQADELATQLSGP